MRWLKVYRVQGTEFRLQASGFWLLNSGSRLLGSGFTRAGEIQQQGGSAFCIPHYSSHCEPAGAIAWPPGRNKRGLGKNLGSKPNRKPTLSRLTS